jgi:polysaccharide biosynthesis PFTS motif protein
MRGYRILKETNQFGLIRKIKRELASVHITQINKTVSELFFGEGCKDAELIVRQYLAMRVGGIGLEKALLYSIGSNGNPVVYPLPKVFQSVLIANNFKVSSGRCSALWIAYVGLIWCYGLLIIARQFYAALRNVFNSTSVRTEKFVFFVGLAKNNLPQPCKDGRSYDVVTWFANWQGFANSPSVFRHDVPDVKLTFINGRRVEFDKNMIPALNSISGLIRFVGWLVYAVLFSATEMFRGRWWNAFLLAEATKSAVVRYATSNQIASEYIFGNSVTIYRPIWTYEAKKKGAQITSYFYSISEEFKLSTGYQPNSTFWELMNWPLYLVWDSYQEDLIRRNVGDFFLIKNVGPILFENVPTELPEIPKNSVAIFDVQPIRSSAHFGFSTQAELYLNPRVPERFIQEIVSVLSMFNFTIVHKRKRNDGNRAVKHYRNLIKDLLRHKNVISVEPSISAIRVIQNCKAVISMPFTSTAIIGRDLGKPSIYYDPIGVIQKDDKGAHGIPIISGQEELMSWLKIVLNKP